MEIKLHDIDSLDINNALQYFNLLGKDAPGHGLRVLNRIEESKTALEYVLKKGYDHWIITFSGGKDSTSTVVIALETALEHLDKIKRIDVIYADTMLEIPTIHQYALSFLHNLRKLPRLKGLPLHCHITYPTIEQRFWVCLLGKGYPPPHQKFRWCTRRLKIEPVENKLNGFIQPGRSVIITGVRFGESKDRDKRLLQSCSRGGECGQGLWFKYSDRLKAGYLAPLIEWSNCDIWDFLLFIAPGMGYSTTELENIYNGHETRFGCWVCTVVRQDKAMERTIGQPQWRYLAPLSEFRKHLWEETRLPETREFRHDGQPGRLRIEARNLLLKRLLLAQEESGLNLINNEEIQYIKKIWKEEGYDE